jgi:hypothetical protein
MIWTNSYRHAISILSGKDKIVSSLTPEGDKASLPHLHIHFNISDIYLYRLYIYVLSLVSLLHQF